MAEAGPREDHFHYDVARHQESEDDAEQRDDGDERVAQGVAVDDTPARQPRRPGGFHVVGFEDLEHGRAHHPGERSHHGEAQRERGEHEVVEGGKQRGSVPGEGRVDHVESREAGGRTHVGRDAPEWRRGHAEQVEEDVEQEQPGPEARHGDAADAEEPARVVERGVAVDGGEHPERNADRRRHQETGQRQLQCGGHALPEVLEDGSSRARGLAEVGAEQAGEVAPVLHMDGPVEAHLPLDRGDVLRRGERARLDERGIAGEHVDERERDQRHPEKCRGDEKEAVQDVPAESHGSGPPGTAAKSASPRNTARTCPSAFRSR